MSPPRSVLITGAGRRAGIAAAVALGLARNGWDVATTYWHAYDESMHRPSPPAEPTALVAEIAALGRRSATIEADLADPEAPRRLFDELEPRAGPFTALLNVHCHSAAGGILDTTAADFDRHMIVNARATLLLCAEFARRFRGEPGTGRIVNLTSDAVHGEVAYGASKAALDRITLAAARELGPRGITVNAVNPGANDTGWMSAEMMQELSRTVPLGRVSTPQDTAELVGFLCSDSGAWITGQILHSNGGAGV